jgi:hypothetical protein
MNGTPTAAAPAANEQKPTTETFPGGKLTADQLVAVKKDVYVE